jgi:GNAT superfamily N-acetyltransferase
MTPLEWRRGDDWISTDRQRLDIDLVVGWLRQSYWAADRSLATMLRSFEHALCLGVYRGQRQIGFCRVVTDYATFGYVADVILAADCRGQGVGTWLMATVVQHPDLQGFRRWILVTRDAHRLYERVGFRALAEPATFMERRNERAKPA